MVNSAERVIYLREKAKDFRTDTIIGIDEEILDFFIEQDDKEEDIELVQDKAYLLVAYTYNWFFGLRKQRLEEKIFGLRNKVEEFRRIVLIKNAEIMEFLQNIWKCYGDLSIKELEKMQNEEREVCKQSILHHYYDVYYEMHEGTVIGDTKLRLSTRSSPAYPHDYKIYYFHSMENEKIGDYLPPNVVLRLNKDGLPEIVKLEPSNLKKSINLIKLSHFMLNSDERIINLRTKLKDFCTDTIIGINGEILDFFIEQDDKEEDIKLVLDKAYLLVAYTYNWFFGLRNKRVEYYTLGFRNMSVEDYRLLLRVNGEIMDFLWNIWECYGDLSIKELEKMQNEEREVCKQSIPHHYYDLYDGSYKRTVIGDTKLRLSTMSFPEYSKNTKIYYFHSMENEKIGDYLPPNVVVRLSNDGLPEIVKLTPELSS